MPVVNKSTLLKKILGALRDEMDSYTRAAKAAHAEATDPQSKAENKYDTRGLEAAYLAGAQSRQAAETMAAIEAYEKLTLRSFKADEEADLTALVEVETRGERMTFFVGPSKGGLEITIGKTEITVITPQAPLGQLLVGRKAGERFKRGSGASAAEYRVLGVT